MGLNNRFVGTGLLRRRVAYSSGLLMDGFTYQVLGGQDVHWKNRKAIFKRLLTGTSHSHICNWPESTGGEVETSEARKAQIAVSTRYTIR